MCGCAQEWQGNANCGDPTDLDKNELAVVWAIHEHFIPRPPKGFLEKLSFEPRDL
jgi:hypothetical protein